MNERRRTRRRRWMWAWAAASLLIAAAWVVGWWGLATCNVTMSNPSVSIHLGLGSVGLSYLDSPYMSASTRLSWRAVPAGERWADWSWLPIWSPQPTGAVNFFVLPNWFFLVPSLSMTLWLWRTGGAPAARRCSSCRYDLTGNTTGICPECGAPAR